MPIIDDERLSLIGRICKAGGYLRNRISMDLCKLMYPNSSFASLRLPPDAISLKYENNINKFRSRMQPSLQGSAFARLQDELIAYWTLFLDERDLLTVSQVNSVLYVFSREEPLWMAHCLRLHNGNFTFRGSWRAATFFPTGELPLHVDYGRLTTVKPMRSFASDFLYRRWIRCHMDLADFTQIGDKRLARIDVQNFDATAFYSRYARVPFILQNAIDQWPAMQNWTLANLATRAHSDKMLRLTHNLDFRNAEKSTHMHFSNYFHYARAQNDETPLYIFDPRFGEKFPEMLSEYNVNSLQIFPEDFLSTIDDSIETEASDVKKPSRPDFRWVVIGPQRSGAPWHTDPSGTSAWNSLISGHKRWALYPPDHPPPGNKQYVKGNSEDYSALDMTSLLWYLEIYPTLQPSDKPYEVIQGPGETIYVPSGWWHMVLNLDETVAVTQNFVDHTNLWRFGEDMVRHQELEFLRHFCRKMRHRKDILQVMDCVQTPLHEGFMQESMYTDTFHIADYWIDALRRISKKHHLGGNKVKSSRVKSMTSRANPVYVVDDKFLVKFYSMYNTGYGEFDLQEYLFPSLDDATKRKSKKQKRSTIEVQDLKHQVALRTAMEEPYRTEVGGYEATCQSPMFPKCLGIGVLDPYTTVYPSSNELGWRWPYLVLDFDKEDVGLRHLLNRKKGMGASSWHQLANFYGQSVFPSLASIRVTGEGLYGHSKAEWEWYVDYFVRQLRRSLAFHMNMNVLPGALLGNLEQFLPNPTEDDVIQHLLPTFYQQKKPTFLHGDLTDENVLGRLSGEPLESESEDDSDSDDETNTEEEEFIVEDVQWTPCKIIDLADSKSGDPIFDLIPVFFSALHGDAELWKKVMSSTYWQEYLKLDIARSPGEQRQRLLRVLLLHPSRAVQSMCHYYPQVHQMETWEQVANEVFKDIF